MNFTRLNNLNWLFDNKFTSMPSLGQRSGAPAPTLSHGGGSLVKRCIRWQWQTFHFPSFLFFLTSSSLQLLSPRFRACPKKTPFQSPPRICAINAHSPPKSNSLPQGGGLGRGSLLPGGGLGGLDWKTIYKTEWHKKHKPLQTACHLIKSMVYIYI